MSDEYVPRCGDCVKHEPTGEDWVVAYADAERDELAWTGWPEGSARLSHCTVTMRCSDQEHARAVEEWRQSSGGGYRRDRVMHLYGGADHA